LRDKVIAGRVEVTYILINKQIANKLIKALTVAKHREFRDIVSIANLKKHLIIQVVSNNIKKLVDILKDLILKEEADLNAIK
jgi:hypothetical protein